MPELSKKELSLITIFGVVISVIGLILFIAFRGEYQQQEFWSIYKVAASGTGMMMLIFGILWVALGLIHLKTRMFDTSAKMDADKLVIMIIAVGIAVVVTLVVTVPKLPSTPPGKLPADPKQRASIVQKERGMKSVVSGIVLACGLVVISGPCARFLKK